MKSIILIILQFFCMVLYCKAQDDSNIQYGQWYYFSDDSIYNELYINEKYYTFLSEKEPTFTFTFDYEFHDDTIYVINGNQITKEQIRNYNGKIMLISESEEYKLYELNKKIIDFYSAWKDLEEYKKFLAGFHDRIRNYPSSSTKVE